MASREPIRQRQRIEQGRPRVVPPIARVRAEQYRVPSDVEGPQLRQGNIAAGGVVAPYLDDQYDRRHHQRQDGDTNSDRREATTGRRADCRLQARVDARRRSISRRKRSMARARFPSHRWAEPARISSEHRPSVKLRQAPTLRTASTRDTRLRAGRTYVRIRVSEDVARSSIRRGSRLAATLAHRLPRL